jgi:hypothetical protein
MEVASNTEDMNLFLIQKTTTSKAKKNDKVKLYSENGKFFANRALIVHQSSYSSSQVEDDEDE